MKIGIIGSGISGNAIAYLLHQHHDITLFEKNTYIGGHSRTVTVNTAEGKIPVDTGFIVYNEPNYPHLTKMFKHLDVPIARSNMSFGVSINNGFLEYGSYHKIGGIFAQKKNIINPAYLKMLRDITKFNKHGEETLQTGTNMTLGEWLKDKNLGGWFKDYYLLAMGAAIWSTPAEKMTAFPAQTFLQFFKNHGLLSINKHPKWNTVKGGSKEYVTRLTSGFQSQIKKNTEVTSVLRTKNHVKIKTRTNEEHEFDHVIFACHSDQILKMLHTPTPAETEIIGAIKYQNNEMILHTDTSFMPKNKKAWSSWVYLSEKSRDNHPQISLSYWMNNLQPLQTKTPIIVTLNPARTPQPETIKDRYQFEHPVFDMATISAQQRINDIQGTDRIWYCGAWQRYGFHEDGLLSAVNIAQKIGVKIPWM